MSDTNKPIVSVIIPNYNYARYLEQRIESIINQTYPNFEIILLDDKSTDDSLEIIHKYKDHDKIAKIIVNEENSGSPFKQWEKGIRESSGDIIWIAESDDYCAPNFLESLVEKHTANSCVVTFCKSRLVDEEGYKLRENHQMAGEYDDVILPGRQFISTYLAFSNVVQNASCAIFSKSVALSIDNSYMDFKGAGDWLFWIEIAENGNVCFVNQELNCYRLHRKSTSATNGIGLKEMYYIYQWLLRNKYLEEKAYQKCRSNNIMLISSLQNISNDTKRELYELWKASSLELFVLRMISLKGIIKKMINKQ